MAIFKWDGMEWNIIWAHFCVECSQDSIHTDNFALQFLLQQETKLLSHKHSLHVPFHLFPTSPHSCILFYSIFKKIKKTELDELQSSSECFKLNS